MLASVLPGSVGMLTMFSHRYACRGDPNSGSCAGWKNTYCCRNDGGRLQEGEVAFEKNATTGFCTKVQKDE